MTHARALILLVAAAAMLTGSPSPGTAAICPDAHATRRTRHVILEGRAYDLAIDRAGRYVVASSRGVLAIDPCTLDVVAKCRDRHGARDLSVGDDGRITYTRADGSARACDLSTGRVAHPSPGAREVRNDDDRVVWVERDRAWMRNGAGEPFALRFSDGVLATAVDPDDGGIAVSDRNGIVSLYSPAGLFRTRYRAHARNAYGLAWDGLNRRVVTVGGAGELALRSAEAVSGSR